MGRLGIWEISMSGIWWNLSGTDKQCDSYDGGRRVHWIQHKLSVREPAPVIPVTVSVNDDGVVLLQGNGLSLERWNHRPGLVRAALLRSVGIAQWKPRGTSSWCRPGIWWMGRATYSASPPQTSGGNAPFTALQP